MNERARSAAQKRYGLAAFDALADRLAELDAGSGVDAILDPRATGTERDRNEGELERVG